MQHQLQFTLIMIFLLPTIILIFVFYYLTKKSIGKEKSDWKRRFKWASIVAKAVTTSIALVFLFSLGGCFFGKEAPAGFSCLFAIAAITPSLVLLLIVWTGAFLVSRVIKKENISMLISINLIFLISGAYVSSYTNPFIDNLLKQRQIKSIQNSEIEQPSLTPTLIKTNLESIKDWKKIKIRNASFDIPQNWSISSTSALNHKSADYIEYRSFYTSDSSINFVIKDYVNIDKILNNSKDINKAIVGFVANEYRINPKELRWGYLYKNGEIVGVKITGPLFVFGGKDVVLFAFYRSGDLYTFSIELRDIAYEKQNEEEIQMRMDGLIDDTIPPILGTLYFDV